MRPIVHKLSIQNLQKKMKTRMIVRDVSLEVSSGEIIGLLGPNGAGKTTCFYMIVGLIPCDRGEIRLDNTDITRLPMHQRALQGLSYLPQEASIFRKLTVKQNILAILEQRAHLDTAAREYKASELLAELHIEHIADEKGFSLSGGERRRVEIARALALQPKFILLDEPFAGVDPISILDIKQIILKLKALSIGVLITDHNVRETLNICERAYIVNEGRLIAEGTPHDILDNQLVKEVYLGQEFSL